MRAKILFVEDEESLQHLLGDRLHSEGYVVEQAADAEAALQRITSAAFDLIILDIMLPGMDGFELCHRIRTSGMATPILMLTARSRTEDKVHGLRIGADDYVTKPFEVRELLARIEVLLRRVPAAAARSAILQFGPLKIDTLATEVTLNAVALNLSAREFQLLRYLAEHRGETLSREQLLQEVWDYSADAYTRTVDVHIASLRNKLRGDDDQSSLIQTVKGIGYKFAP
jgi:two-component system, OmpR family, alkaline phosphatase synthesis response regulator PhoP